MHLDSKRGVPSPAHIPSACTPSLPRILSSLACTTVVHTRNNYAVSILLRKVPAAVCYTALGFTQRIGSAKG